MSTNAFIKTGRLGMALFLALLLALIGSAAVLALAMGGTISGTVNSPAGYPLPAGTVVKLFEPGSETVLGQAQVDSGSGAFSIGPVSNGLYVLKAAPPAASGFTQSEPVPVSVLGGPVTGVALSITTPQIAGLVMSPDGVTPVTATVKVFMGDETLLQWVPAPGGRFAIGGLPAGSYALRALPAVDEPFWKSPFETVSLTGGVTRSLTLTLTRAQLWGLARDHLGNPVANAEVYAAQVGSPWRYHSDFSSGSGFWAVGGLEDGEYHLTARPPFNQPELLPPHPLTVTLPGGASNPYTLTFGSSPKVVSGSVTVKQEGSNGLPVQNALVEAHRIDKHGQAKTLTGADGSYQLRLSAGLWAMTVKEISATTPSNWVYPQPPQLVHFQHNTEAEGKTQNFEVVIADSEVVGRVVLPAGSLTPGSDPFSVTVALFNDEGIGRRATVPISESFSLQVPNGSYKVVVHPHHPQYLGPVIAPITVSPGETYDLGDLTLVARDAVITGVVRNSAGDGVPNIPIMAWRSGTPDTLRTRTGPDGAYILPLTAGRWRAQPAPAPDQPYLYAGSGEALELTAGEVISDVNFALVGANAVINGLLIDEDGSLIEEVDGWARAANTITPTLRNGAPIQSGVFTIYVPAGEYNVAAYLPAGSRYMSGYEKKISVAAGESVTVTLTAPEKDAHITGALWNPREEDVVEGVNGAVGAWAEGNWAGTHINAGNGTYKLNVAAGLWHLGYRIDLASGYVKLISHKNVPVQSGQTVAVPLPVVARDSVITGVVLAPDGSPLGGVTVMARGVGPTIEHITLKTLSRANGAFALPVPYGRYRLGALGDGPNVIKPVEILVDAPPGHSSGGHILQFQRADATVSGTLSISGTPGLNGEALVWAWSDDGGFIRGRFAISNSTGSYALNVISNTTWHLGAAFETSSQFWSARETLTLGSGGAVQNLTLTGPYAKPGPVVVTFDAADAQRIELSDGTNIFIPAGAMPVSGQVTLRVVPIATLPHQHHANLYKYGYAFMATDSEGQTIEEHFNQDVIIAFTYEDEELARLGIFEPLLKPAYYSTVTDSWTFPDSYAVDTANNLVTMQIDHFTDFTLTGDAPETIYLPLVLK